MSNFLHNSDRLAQVFLANLHRMAGEPNPSLLEINLEDYPIDYIQVPDFASIWMSKRGLLQDPGFFALAEAKVKELNSAIIPHYNSKNLYHANLCGPNAQYIFNKLHSNPKYEMKIIYIAGWKDDYTVLKTTIYPEREKYFGPIGMTMHTSYHAFPLFQFPAEGITLAIETTICLKTLKLQYIFGQTEADIEEFIRKRYRVDTFKTTTNSKASWPNIVYSGGGRRSRRTARCIKKTRKIQKIWKSRRRGVRL